MSTSDIKELEKDGMVIVLEVTSNNKWELDVMQENTTVGLWKEMPGKHDAYVLTDEDGSADDEDYAYVIDDELVLTDASNEYSMTFERIS